MEDVNGNASQEEPLRIGCKTSRTLDVGSKLAGHADDVVNPLVTQIVGGA